VLLFDVSKNQIFSSLLRKKVRVLKVVFVKHNDCRLKALIDVPISERSRQNHHCWHSFCWKSIDAIELLLEEH
jgi:hypothetical protein